MKFKTLASGSKGNSSIIISDDTKLIVDLGISNLRLKKALEKLNYTIDDFDGILITHCHNDHIKGLTTTVKKNNILVYAPRDMVYELSEFIDTDKIVVVDENFKIGDINITYFNTSHDADCSVGYVFSNDDKSIAYITDTGYINRRNYKKIEGKDLYLIESNHDVEMLMEGPYPPYLKQRVLSDVGHLSNDMAATYISKLISDNTHHIVLAHLSEKNNTEEKAMDATTSKLKDINRDDIEVLIARQEEEGPLIEV